MIVLVLNRHFFTFQASYSEPFTQVYTCRAIIYLYIKGSLFEEQVLLTAMKDNFGSLTFLVLNYNFNLVGCIQDYK